MPLPIEHSPEAMEDSRTSAEAKRMAELLLEYGVYRRYAMEADVRGDTRTAALFRADARAALHTYPALLDMVEKREQKATGPIRAYFCEDCG